MLRRVRRAFMFLVEAVEIAARLAAACLGLGWSAAHVLIDLRRSRKALRGGVLHCPTGHEVPTEGDTYECSGCGYVYGGSHASIWECGNPECRAITPYISCPTCGLSIRNPYRWGRS